MRTNKEYRQVTFGNKENEHIEHKSHELATIYLKRKDFKICTHV